VNRAARRSGPAPIRSTYLLPLVAAVGIALHPASLRAASPPAGSAPAQLAGPNDHRRVLLLVDSPGDPFMDRIRAEVVSLGLEGVVRAPQGSIEAKARAEHAVAAIRILPSRNGVEVWMADAASGRSLLRQVIVDETPRGPNQDVIALQTAELLRTGLFPETPPAGPRPVPSPPVIVQSAPARSDGESALGTGVELLYSAGGASPAWQAWFSFQHLWSRRLGIALDVSAPFRRGTMSGPEGTADVGAIVVGVEMLARFRSERGRLFLTTGLGAGAVALLTKGHPSPEGSAQVESNSSTAYTALGFARITLGCKLSSWLGLGMSGLVGTTVARVDIRFGGNDAGDWGVPLLGAALFAQVDWH
jgi:hypothetical protein